MKAGKKKKKKGNRGDMWKSPGGVWNIFNMKAGKKRKKQGNRGDMRKSPGTLRFLEASAPRFIFSRTKN